MDTSNTQPNAQRELFNTAPKPIQKQARACIKAMLKRMEPTVDIALPWVKEAKADMRTGSDFFWGDE